MEFQGRVASKGSTLVECLANAEDLDADATDHVTLSLDGTEPGGVAGDLSALARFPRLTKLRVFGAVDHASLASLSAIGDRLQYLHCLGPVRVRDLTSLSGVARMERLQLEGLEGLAGLDGVGSLARLNDIELVGEAIGIEDVAALGELPGLRRVRLQGFVALRNASTLAACSQLEVLELVGARALAATPDLASWPRLKELRVSGATELSGLPGLAGCAKLKVLDLEQCDALAVAGDVSRLSKLAELRIVASPKVALPDDGAVLPLLRKLAISANHLPSEAFLEAHGDIDDIEVSGGVVTDVGRLAALVSSARKTITLEGLQGIPEAAWRRQLIGRASRVSIGSCGKLGSARWLASLPGARWMALEGVDIDDHAVSSITALPVLESLSLVRCSGLHNAAALVSAPALRRLDVQDCGDLDYGSIQLPAGAELHGDAKARARAKLLKAGG